MAKNKKKSKKIFPQAQSPKNPLVIPNNANVKNKGLISRSETVAFSGPLPPPDLLIKYGEIIPNGADRILKMAENQSAHRQHIERWAIIGGTILSHFGVLCAAIIAISSFYFSSQLVREGHTIPGSIFAGTCLVGLVSAFIYGTHSRKEERQQRDQRNKELIGQK